MKLPRVTGREVVQAVELAGFIMEIMKRQTGP